MINNKEQFVQASQQQQADEEARNLESAIKAANRLQEGLAEIGIESEVSETGSVFIANDYQFTSATTNYNRPTYFLHKGERKVDLYHSRLSVSIIASIGKAMTQLDKPERKKEEPKHRYTFSGDTIGEILEQIMREIAREEAEQYQ